jgi:hypothetical protein
MESDYLSTVDKIVKYARVAHGGGLDWLRTEFHVKSGVRAEVMEYVLALVKDGQASPQEQQQQQQRQQLVSAGGVGSAGGAGIAAGALAHTQQQPQPPPPPPQQQRQQPGGGGGGASSSKAPDTSNPPGAKKRKEITPDARAEAATRELAEQVLRETGMRLGDDWGAVWEATDSKDQASRKRFIAPDGKKFSSQSQVVIHFQKIKEQQEGSAQPAPAAPAAPAAAAAAAARRKRTCDVPERFRMSTESTGNGDKPSGGVVGHAARTPVRSRLARLGNSSPKHTTSGGLGEDDRDEEAAKRELADNVRQETGIELSGDWIVKWEKSSSGGRERKRFIAPDGKKFSSQSKVLAHFHKEQRAASAQPRPPPHPAAAAAAAAAADTPSVDSRDYLYKTSTNTGEGGEAAGAGGGAGPSERARTPPPRSHKKGAGEKAQRVGLYKLSPVVTHSLKNAWLLEPMK